MTVRITDKRVCQIVRSGYCANAAIDKAFGIIEEAKNEVMSLQSSGEDFSPDVQQRLTLLNFVLATILHAKRELP